MIHRNRFKTEYSLFHAFSYLEKNNETSQEKPFKHTQTLLNLERCCCSSGAPPVNSNKNGVSIAKEGCFPLFVGKLPKLTDLGFEDLNLCKVFHGKTCSSASNAVESLATYGEAVKDCLDLFELLECSICQSGTLPICDRVFEACSDAYFSSDATSDQVRPVCVNSKGKNTTL